MDFSATFNFTVSTNLIWCLREEPLEIQVCRKFVNLQMQDMSSVVPRFLCERFMAWCTRADLIKLQKTNKTTKSGI